MPLRIIKTHDAVSASSTGTINIAGVQKASLQATCASLGTYGSALIYVFISNDGSNWVPFHGIIPMEPTETVEASNWAAARDFIRTGVICMSGDGSSVFILDPLDCFKHMRVTLDYDTSGSYSVILGLQEGTR